MENDTVFKEEVKKSKSAVKAEKKAEKKKIKEEKPSPCPLLAVAIVFTLIVIGVYLIVDALIVNHVF